jgi:hypothetical protein
MESSSYDMPISTCEVAGAAFAGEKGWSAGSREPGARRNGAGEEGSAKERKRAPYLVRLDVVGRDGLKLSRRRSVEETNRPP